MRLDELNAVRRLKLALTEAEEKLKRVDAALTNATAIRDGLPRAAVLTSRIERLTLKRLELLSTLDNLRGRLEETAIDLATRICQTVPDEFDQTLLLLRYVECLSWTQVAERLDFERRSVFRLHKKILSLACTSSR